VPVRRLDDDGHTTGGPGADGTSACADGWVLGTHRVDFPKDSGLGGADSLPCRNEDGPTTVNSERRYQQQVLLMREYEKCL
jgi:hypothetical protein